MFKAMILLTKRSDMSSEEFAHWWRASMRQYRHHLVLFLCAPAHFPHFFGAQYQYHSIEGWVSCGQGRDFFPRR